MEDPDVRVVVQSFAEHPLGRVRRAAFFNNSRGIRTPSMRVLGSFAAVYVLDGRGRYQDANGSERDIVAGDLLLLFPDIPHRYGPPDGETWREFYVMFEGAVFDLWRQSGLLNPAEPVHHVEPIPYWLKRLESAVEPPRSGVTELDPLPAVCRLQQVLADVLAHVTERRMGTDERAWLDRAYAALDESCATGEAVDWDEFSERRFEMSYENFRKRFARLAGTPPARYRMRRVMERASELMHQSHMTLKQVAATCGFCNEFHFSRRFKQMVGMSPREFRRQLPR